METHNDTNDTYDVVVVGAGLAGLTAGAAAARAGARVVVLDAKKPGGRASTDTRSGFALNQGAHALYRGGEGRKVLARLGLDPKGDQPPLGGGMVLRHGELAPLPGGPAALARSKVLSPRSKAKLAALLGRLPRIKAERYAGISAAAWLDDLDLREDARSLVELLMRTATYCSDFTRLSAAAGISQMRSAYVDGVDYLHGGWQPMVDSILGAGATSGMAVVSGQSVKEITAADAGAAWEVRTADRALRAEAVVVAAGGPDAARGMLPADPGWGDLGPASTAACLDLGLRRPSPVPIVLGMGEPVYFSSHCPPADMAPAGHGLVQLMRYGARTSDEDRDELRALARLAGIGEADVIVERFLHKMVTAFALPRPEAGGTAGRPAAAVSGLPGIFVAGDWVGPVGMLADASLASGESAGKQAAAVARKDLVRA